MQREIDALIKVYLDEVRSEAQTIVKILALIEQRRNSQHSLWINWSVRSHVVHRVWTSIRKWLRQM